MSRTSVLGPVSARRLVVSVVLAALAPAAPATLVALATPTGAAGQQTCPRASGPDAQAGWKAYHRGDMTAARTHFQAALARCSDDQYARTGLGYVELRAGSDARARELFEAVVAAQPNDVDALVGLGLVAWRGGDLEAVSDRFQKVLRLAPGNATAKEYLAKLPPGLGPPPKRPPLIVPDTLVYPARVQGDRFEVRTSDGWKPFYLKGVNLGTALPGKYPSQFPDSATYARWIAQIAAMNANVVRTYTIHPPSFYEDLRAWNLAHPDRPLWLVQGVWTEPPETVDSSNDYLAPDFEAQFFAEMKRVVDLVHGRANIRPRAGHASGFYTADVSPWTLAYIIGREWEPYSVVAFDSLHTSFTAWRGSYVRLDGGNAMEAWLAKAVDHMVSYETETYHAQRPVAYTNWPTLDPLHHPTESTRAQEVAMREKLGERVDFKPREYNNDIVGLDASKMRATAADPAGVFASYHAYPYYPDFMVLQPSYRKARSSYGASNYFGYLEALKAHDAGMPVVIAEYGVPASLGPAHLQPQGMHQGGHSEEDQAHVDRRLTREIAQAGMAGGIVFSWIDEWFKKNWLTIDFELPAARNRLWYNRLDAEQQYGMMAMDARPPLPGATLHQRRSAWSKVPPLYQDSAGTVRAISDDAYLWLYVETPHRRPGDTLYVGLDIRAPKAGEFRWPGHAGAVGPRLPVGVEFVVEDDGKEVQVLADPAMNPFRLVPVGQGTRARPGKMPTIEEPPAGFFTGRLEQRFNLPYRLVPRSDGVYDSLRVISNRRRIGRDSVEYLAMGYDRGVLPRGGPPDGYWERDGDVEEIRIPWMLVDVTDPSSRSVLAGPGAGASRAGRTAAGLVRLSGGQEVAPDTLVGQLAIEKVKSIGIVAALRRTDGRWETWPEGTEATARFTWPTWGVDGVRWRERERPVYDTMAATFAALDPYHTGGARRVDGSDSAKGAAKAAAVRGKRSAPAAAAHPVRPTAQHPAVVPQQIDSADAAWKRGDHAAALMLYLQRLQRDSTDEVALHRVALMEAWAGHYAEALELLDRVVKEDPANLDAQVDRARVTAWSGNTSKALNELAKILKAHPHHAGALQARATFEAWAGQYDESLSTYDQLLAISPGNTPARRQEAKVLAWASRFAASRALYDSLLAQNPEDMNARLGLAQVLTYANDLDGALREYRRVLASRPNNAKALQGEGRALSWDGKLVQGEEAYRKALVADSTDVAGLVGLAQNLRWQGRNAAALEVLERARRVAPNNGDVREQLRWVNVALGRQVRPGVVVENDSDHNHMVTASATAAWHPLPRLGLRADAYQRSMTQNALNRSAYGVTVSGSWQARPGWTFSAGAGGSRSNGTGRASFAKWNLGLSTPGRYPEGGAFTISSSALDATAILAQNGVVLTQASLSGRWTGWSGWRVDASVGRATVDGPHTNLRGNGSFSVSRRLKRVWSVGVDGRAFGFQKQVHDGYFAPDFYGIAEVSGRWLYEPAPWSFRVEVAPGVQRVGKSGNAAGALRVSTRVAYRVTPGREISLGFGYSSTGLQSFSTGASSYRYTALILGATWLF